MSIQIVQKGRQEEQTAEDPFAANAQEWVTRSLESVGARMYRAAAVELYGEPYRTLDETLALVDAVTSDDIRKVAREFFAPDKQTVLSLGPAPIV